MKHFCGFLARVQFQISCDHDIVGEEHYFHTAHVPLGVAAIPRWYIFQLPAAAAGWSSLATQPCKSIFAPSFVVRSMRRRAHSTRSRRIWIRVAEWNNFLLLNHLWVTLWVDSMDIDILNGNVTNLDPDTSSDLSPPIGNGRNSSPLLEMIQKRRATLNDYLGGENLLGRPIINVRDIR